jgi:integrase/recombinase XerD
MKTIQTSVKKFLSHCRFEKNLSPKTIKSYSIDLKQLFSFLITKNYSINIDEITKNELREFLESISSLKPKSVKRKIATIKAMFNYLEFEDIIIVNPFRKMYIKIKEPQKLPRVMDIIEIRKIFACAYQKHSLVVNSKPYKYFEKLRNIVIIELLFATGARVSEIANLKISNIDTGTGIIKLMGKGNKERIIQVCNYETLKILKDYYKLYIEKIYNSGGFFLINRL